MSDKYGECYCGDCVSFNKCKSDKGTRINLVSEGCSCFEPNDIAEFDYPILPKWLAEHDNQILREFLAWYSGGETMPSFGRYAKCKIDDVIAEWQKGAENE